MTMLSITQLANLIASTSRSNKRKMKKKKFIALNLIAQSMKRKYQIIGRVRNKVRNRPSALTKIDDLSDALFKRMFRLDRATFNEVLSLIEEKLSSDNKQAQRSSKFPITPKLKLAIALRFLAGGIYLDIAFSFDISEKHVLAYVWEVCEALDSALDNINFPIEDEEALRDIEAGFLNICNGRFPGTVAAGDGVVFRIQKPNKEAVDGDVSSFFTRKGYYAYGMQAFVDSSCKFRSISMKLCSSVHDSTAYIVSELSKRIKAGALPRWAHIVLDEAYPCTEQELSPFKGRNLDVWKDSFNYYLSLHRQVVERAFGILVQRFGVFWRPLRVAFKRIPLLIKVCCKLHNLCIDRFGVGESIGIARGDVQRGDTAAAMFTDGTGNFRGRRSDLEFF